MQNHLRAIGVLMAVLFIAALAGCGGSIPAGSAGVSSVHQPQLSSHPGQFKLDTATATATFSGANAPRAAQAGDVASAETRNWPVETGPGRTASLVGDFAELDAMPVPAGADPYVFMQLKQALKRMLAAKGNKTASAPPSSGRSKVNDLQGTGDTTNATFTWTYRNEGDFNQDRVVNVQDLAPLGAHFGKNNTAADWNIAQLADGNADGQVGLGDLVSIGANFNKKVDGYHMQFSTDGATGWAQVADVLFASSAIPGGGGHRLFTHNLGPATAGFYRVIPYDVAVEGVISDAVQFPGGGGPLLVAVLTATPSSGDPPLDVDFDGSTSHDDTAGNSITKYEFDFGEGAGYEDYAMLSAASHTYAANGTFTAKLRVTNNLNETDEDSKTITVGAQSDLFTEALTGVTMDPTLLNLSFITEPLTFGDTFTNYGFDVAQFDNAGTLEGVPGSRFGGFTNYWHDDHTQLPVWSAGYTDAVDGAGTIEGLVKAADDKFFEGDSRQTFFAGGPVDGSDFTPAGTDPLATAVIDLITNNGGTPDAPGITTDASDVPAELQDALAMVLQAADAAGSSIQAYKTTFFGAYDGADPSIWTIAYDHSHTFFVPITPAFLWTWAILGIGSDDGGATWYASNTPYSCVIDYTTFAQAQINLAHALDQAHSVLSGGTVTGSFSFDQVTPIGRIQINSGDGDTTYTQTEDPVDPSGYYLLLCDVDGNDTYNCNAGANGNMFNPVSINLDLAGNDTYAALDDPTDGEGMGDDVHSQQGAGRWGVGILADYAGNDVYETSQAGQGFSVVGWGLLYDLAGDDSYTGVNHVQGSGIFGVGMLCDMNGTDTYIASGAAQGFGEVWGVGLLYDKGTAADNYFAEWDTTAIPAFFGYAQGSARGYQGGTDDMGVVTIPVILDGGLGTLIDQGGDDIYTAFARSQGCGFWFGTGVFDDRAGNDTYETDAISTGSALTFGAGMFMDRAGNDKYNTTYDVRGFPLGDLNLGGGYNYAEAWFLDGGGDDLYVGAPLGLGTGAMNGWGYFCDMGNGVDDYAIPVNADDNQKTLGRGYLSGDAAEGDTRETQTTFGLFIDCGGADTYDANYATIPSGSIGDVSAGNDLGWYRFGYDNDFANNFRLFEFGTGLDGTGVVGFEFN